jgi:hypothetical protein
MGFSIRVGYDVSEALTEVRESTILLPVAEASLTNEHAVKYPDEYLREIEKLSALSRSVAERASLIPDISRVAQALELRRSHLTPAVLAAIESSRVHAGATAALGNALQLIRESTQLSVRDSLAVSASLTASDRFAASAREIAAAALPVHRLFGDSTEQLAAVALPNVTELYGGTVRDIVASSLPSLGMAAAFAAAVRSTHLDFHEHYESLRITAASTAEMQALLASISVEASISDAVRPLTSSLSLLARASADIWTALPQDQHLSELPLKGWLLEAPIVQTYEASRNIVQLTGLSDESEEFEFTETQTSYRPTSEDVISRLARLGKDFVKPYRSAKDVLNSRRGDYMRHTAVSLRELLDKLLRELAPDSQISQWPESLELLKNRQDRKARLRFIFRQVLGGEYALFAEKDVDLIAQTFIALNKAVHSLEEPFLDSELRILVARVDGHLSMLLEAADMEQSH